MSVPRDDSKGQALGSLIARFTADRDAMLAQIYACQERVQDLVGRLDEHGLPMGGPSPASSPGRLDELETAVSLLREEVTTVTAEGHRAARDLRGLVETVRTTAAQAMERADRASADVDTVLERLGIEMARLETDTGGSDEVVALRVAVERLEAAGVVAPAESVDTMAAETALAELRQELAAVTRLVEQLGAVQAAREATFDGAVVRGEALADTVARVVASQDATDAAVARLAADQAETAAVLAGLAAGSGDAAVAEMRRDLEAALATVVAGQRPLADGLDELQQSHGGLRGQLELLREVVEGLTGWAGSAVPREALDVIEAGTAEVTARMDALERGPDALRAELGAIPEVVEGVREEAAAARQEAAAAIEVAASVRQEARGALEAAEAAARTAAEVRDASDADRRRIEDRARREIAGLRAAFEGGLAGLGTRLDEAMRAVVALDERRASLEASMHRVEATLVNLDERVQNVEDAVTRVIALREPVGESVGWVAVEALWARVSAFVATPIIDIRDSVWQLARAARSVAKSW